MPIAAGKIRVLIATTNGPVEVLLLTEEDAAIGRCVACIGGTTETADIAAAYHAFVVRPTGIIESRFGHSCYRLDVSGRIDAGSSWQLGVLAAHALLAAGRLAQENDAADAVLWATGSVRPVDLTVGAVSHVPEKLANSLERLKQERAAGRRVLLALPAGNAAEVSPELAGELSSLGIEQIAPAHVQGLFDALAMKLPDGPGKATAKTVAPAAPPPPPPPVPPPAAPVTAPRRRWMIPAAAAAMLLAIAGAAAVLFKHWGAADSAATSAPQVVAAPKLSAVPARVPLVAEQVPFITPQDRARIRDDYMKAPGYKALATSLVKIAFVSGQPTQEAADRAAMEVCEKLNAGTANKVDAACDLYASGDIVVTRRNRPTLPPEPWVVRNPSVERSFVAAEMPLATSSSRDQANKSYPASARPKALVLAPNGNWWSSSAQASLADAMRRSLERCGYATGDPCMVIAVDDTFVVPIPTLAKVVGFYRQGALFGVKPEAADEIARRLAAGTDGWNALAVGAGGNVGIAAGAGSERSALDGALADCAKHDSKCRIAVLGPFLVEATSESPPPHQAQPQPQPQQPQPKAQAEAEVHQAQPQPQPPPQPQPQPQAQEQKLPPPPAPAQVALVPDLVPFISTRDKERIRDEYMAGPDYKAIALSLMHIAVITGRPSQEAADRAALESCEKQEATARSTTCELYASGNVVVTRHSRPPMPAQPWVVRNRAVEQPFEVAQIPMLDTATRERIAKGYPRRAGSKAFVMSATRKWVYVTEQPSFDDAVRMSLERCGHLASNACMVVAIDGAFVIPIPTLAKAVGFYRPEALAGVTPEVRDDVARRLASTPNAWNAVAVGAGGNVGVALGADSELGALDGALADCAKHDHDCRIVVMGPFLVELADQEQKRTASP